MQKGPSLYPDKEIFLGKKGQTTIFSEESSSILKRSPRHPLGESPLNTKDTVKCLARKNHKGYPDTPFGTTLSNYSLEPLRSYQVDSFPSPKARLLKHKNS